MPSCQYGCQQARRICSRGAWTSCTQARCSTVGTTTRPPVRRLRLLGMHNWWDSKRQRAMWRSKSGVACSSDNMPKNSTYCLPPGTRPSGVDVDPERLHAFWLGVHAAHRAHDVPAPCHAREHGVGVVHTRNVWKSDSTKTVPASALAMRVSISLATDKAPLLICQKMYTHFLTHEGLSILRRLDVTGAAGVVIFSNVRPIFF